MDGEPKAYIVGYHRQSREVRSLHCDLEISGDKERPTSVFAWSRTAISIIADDFSKVDPL